MTIIAAAVEMTPDRHVRCPHCQHDIQIKSTTRGTGAAYTKLWRTVPKQLKRIIATWVSCDQLRDAPHTKVTARHILNEYGHHNLTENAASARISELLSLKVLSIYDYETRDTPHRTRHAPRYAINMCRASEIIEGKI